MMMILLTANHLWALLLKQQAVFVPGLGARRHNGSSTRFHHSAGVTLFHSLMQLEPPTKPLAK